MYMCILVNVLHTVKFILHIVSTGCVDHVIYAAFMHVKFGPRFVHARFVRQTEYLYEYLYQIAIIRI